MCDMEQMSSLPPTLTYPTPPHRDVWLRLQLRTVKCGSKGGSLRRETAEDGIFWGAIDPPRQYEEAPSQNHILNCIT